MKNLKRIFFTILLIFILFLLVDKSAFASTNQLQKVEYSERFKKWLELSDEEKQNVLQPRMYDVLPTTTDSKNIFYKIRLVGASINSTYDLRNIIPANLKIRNQMNTNTCWAFAALSSLETNLALYDYKQNGYVSNPKIYDFSERHMDYATSQTFKNGEQNKLGYNRQVRDGGAKEYAQSYLINGSGAINEADMQFKDDMSPIDLSEIQGKTITSQVYDTINFPDYNAYPEQKANIMQQIKQHIKDYGSIYASVHKSFVGSPCYNNTTAAIYCSDPESHETDHAVSIVGWDDNYSRTKFKEGAQPNSDGAWIIRNSWGEKLEYDLAELKQAIFDILKKGGRAEEYTSADQIPNGFLEYLGYTIEGPKAYLKVGDNGFMYISYEDCNVSTNLWGIVKATNSLNYENIYQYDEFRVGANYEVLDSKAMLANVFEKKTSGDEYLTQVALSTPETYTCKVYVNPNGEERDAEHLTQVNLKEGETETFGAGYHTLEFAQPIKITGTKFTVVIGIQGTSNNVRLALECKLETPALNNVTTQKEKCFYSEGNSLQDAEWQDLGKLSQVDDGYLDCDSTIKAFTRSTQDIKIKVLQSIQVITPPTKTQYLVGENFEKAGIKVQANYSDGTHIILNDTDYSITNGTSLTEEQTSVTITYEGQTTTQKITVEKNNVTALTIATPPTKTEYIEGENFNPEGMVVKATYKDETTKEVPKTDYTIEDGNNLDAGQTTVTISYEGKSVTQTITVTQNLLLGISITKAPNKTEYIEGENFNPEGMVVKATYKDGTTKEVPQTDYTIEDGNNLDAGQTTVTISYEGKLATQAITVTQNLLLEISITKAPNKTEYVVGQNFNPEGMIVTGTYQNGATQTILDYTVENGTNLTKEQTSVTIKYKDKTATQAITVVEKTITAISINTEPTKLTYIKERENLDLTGGTLKITYNNGTFETIPMTAEGVTVTGFSNEKVGKVTITVTYQNKTVQFEVQIIEQKAENSNLSNATSNVKKVKAYFYTNGTKKDYVLIDVEVNNISLNKSNDKVEYYYYLSSNANEKGITNWVKITEEQNDTNKLQFTIDSREISNYSEISDEGVVYLYVKEVAVKGGNQSVEVSKSMKLETDKEIETYVNDVKKDTSQTNKPSTNGKDDTTAPGKIPDTGIAPVIIICIAGLAVFGVVAYIKYNKFKES